MIPLLGIACVAWTAYEILRLVELGRRAGLGTETPRTTAPASRSRGRRFAACPIFSRNFRICEV